MIFKIILVLFPQYNLNLNIYKTYFQHQPTLYMYLFLLSLTICSKGKYSNREHFRLWIFKGNTRFEDH